MMHIVCGRTCTLTTAWSAQDAPSPSQTPHSSRVPLAQQKPELSSTPLAQQTACKQLCM